MIGGSLLTLLVKAITSYNNNRINSKESGLYDPINKSQLPSYGAVSAENNEDTDSHSSNTVFSSQELIICHKPWSICNCARLVLSAIQLALVIYLNLTDDDEELDKQVEGNYRDMVHMYYAHIGFWVIKKKVDEIFYIN